MILLTFIHFGKKNYVAPAIRIIEEDEKVKEIRRAAEGVSSVRDGQKQTNNTHGERKTDSHARRQTHKGLGGKVEK